MKHATLIISFVFLNLISVAAQELTPEGLIQLHLQALGDQELLEQALVCELEGDLKVTKLGNTREFRYRSVATRDGKRYREVSNTLGGVLSKMAWNGDEGWKQERGKLYTLEGPQRAMLEAGPFISPFTDPAYYLGQIIGQKSLDTKYVLTIKDPNGEIHTYNLHPQTFLLMSETYRDDLGVLNMVKYLEYEEMAGLQFPTKIKHTRFIDNDDGPPQKEVHIKGLKSVKLYQEPEERVSVFYIAH